MLTSKDKAQLLRDAVEMLHEADRLQQLALSGSDVCYENHHCIQELIEDFEADVEDLDARAEGMVP